MASGEEPMDTSNNATMDDANTKLPLPKPALDSPVNDEDKAKLKVSLSSPETFEPKKFKNIITKTLLTWASKNGIKAEFVATEMSDDGKKGVITVKPAAALSELLKLSEKEFITKEQKKFSMKMHQDEPSQVDEQSSVGQASSMNLTNTQNGQSMDKSDDDDSSANDGNGNREPLIVALGPYWYMKSIYQDRIEQIERKNGVKISENVQVTISPDQKHADPKKAYDEFIRLVQSCLSESGGLTVPLKKIGLEELQETLNFIQTTNGKCEITISSDHVTIFGPPQYQTAIGKSLQRTKISTNYTDNKEGIKREPERERTRMNSNSFDKDRKTPDRSRFRISMTSKDPFVSEGLTFEDHYWDLMTTQNKKDIDRIKDKFNVSIKDRSTQGKTVVNVRYNKPEGNMSLESHAIRALLRLYQKVATYKIRGINGMFDKFEEDLYRGVEETKGAYGQTSMDRQTDTQRFTEGGANQEPSGAKAKKGEKEEETCPVCMDAFKEKTKLKCKHEFCKDCLDQAVKSLGAMCPVCKDVFGLVEGDQPKGTMTWKTSPMGLPGFTGCGSIEITYDIPSGQQTKKHPNPGRPYFGLHRTAYLPDNREGREVLKLLKRAFDQRLTFTVGTSRTTGQDDVVTWNDIHHKTTIYGGQQGFGYPDPDYLSRVKDELKAKGIK